MGPLRGITVSSGASNLVLRGSNVIGSIVRRRSIDEKRVFHQRWMRLDGGGGRADISSSDRSEDKAGEEHFSFIVE